MWDYQKESEYGFLMDAISKSSILQVYLSNLVSFSNYYENIYDNIKTITDELVKKGKEMEQERRSVCKCP